MHSYNPDQMAINARLMILVLYILLWRNHRDFNGFIRHRHPYST